MDSAPTGHPTLRARSKRHMPTRLKAAIALVVCVAMGLLLLNQLLHTPQAPQGIVNLQLAGNAEHTRAIVQSWSPQQQGWARLSLWLDLLLVALYFTTLLALTRYLLQDRPGVRERTTGRWVLILFAVAALSDCVENLTLLVNLQQPSDALSLAATLAALIKFTGLLLGSAGLVIIRAARRHPLVPS